MRWLIPLLLLAGPAMGQTLGPSEPLPNWERRFAQVDLCGTAESYFRVAVTYGRVLDLDGGLFQELPATIAPGKVVMVQQFRYAPGQIAMIACQTTITTPEGTRIRGIMVMQNVNGQMASAWKTLR